jgi:hypothetical protein
VEKGIIKRELSASPSFQRRGSASSLGTGKMSVLVVVLIASHLFRNFAVVDNSTLASFGNMSCCSPTNSLSSSNGSRLSGRFSGRQSVSNGRQRRPSNVLVINNMRNPATPLSTKLGTSGGISVFSRQNSSNTSVSGSVNSRSRSPIFGNPCSPVNILESGPPRFNPGLTIDIINSSRMVAKTSTGQKIVASAPMSANGVHSPINVAVGGYRSPLENLGGVFANASQSALGGPLPSASAKNPNTSPSSPMEPVVRLFAGKR